MTIATDLRVIQWNRHISLIALVLLLLTPLVALTEISAINGPSRAHPALIDLATAQPDRLVRVIVQKTVADGQIEALIGRLGGAVLGDLRIINAVTAELPARAVPTLAKAVGIRWISPDGQVESTAGEPAAAPGESWTQPNFYLDTLDVRRVWGLGRKGQGIGVAVIDSGLSNDADLRVGRQMGFSPNSRTSNDVYGHGTHVAGIIAGTGASADGYYSGIAPDATLYGLKISDEQGLAYESDTVRALQWVLDNKATYNLRVVNLSINSTVEQSYHLSPLNAAAEIVWFNGVVVVVSAGNTGTGGGYNAVKAAPANDPFVITVGAADEKGTTRTTDDAMASYSAYGTTLDGTAKPDILAPGTRIYSVLSKDSDWATQYPDRVVNGEYFRLSGTSMAAPMVAGAVALLLQDEPTLTPDQVKYRLMNAPRRTLTLPDGRRVTYLDVYATVTGTTTASANTGLRVSNLLTSGSDPVNSSVNWNSVNWNSVNWNSVNWNSVNWNSVNWNSVNWNSVSWRD